MNAQNLYDNLKRALNFFELSFHQMNKMEVHFEKIKDINHICYSYEGEIVKYPITEKVW